MKAEDLIIDGKYTSNNSFWEYPLIFCGTFKRNRFDLYAFREDRKGFIQLIEFTRDQIKNFKRVN